MKQLILKQDIKPIVCCLFISLVAGFAMNILVLCSVMFGQHFGTGVVQVMNELSILIALAGIPYLIYKKIPDYEPGVISQKTAGKNILLGIAIGSSLLIINETSAVIHFLVVAFSEEVLFRVVQYRFLEKQIGVRKAIIFSSIIFAFVLHLNDPFIGNLLIRLPLGIVLCFLRYKFGVAKSVYAHWIYDVVISVV